MLEPDEKSTIRAVDSGGRPYSYIVISEPGLYAVIMRSSKPEAKEFQRWVTHDVLPQIRKTGSYGVSQVPTIITADFMQRITDQMRSLEQQVADQQHQIEYMEPKAEFYDYALQSSESLTTTMIAKEFGKTAQELNRLLHEWGIQFKRGSRWYLYAEYADKGYHIEHVYLVEEGCTNTQMRWTHKGRKFIHELMMAHGYTPNVLVTQ